MTVLNLNDVLDDVISDSRQYNETVFRLWNKTKDENFKNNSEFLKILLGILENSEEGNLNSVYHKTKVNVSYLYILENSPIEFEAEMFDNEQRKGIIAYALNTNNIAMCVYEHRHTCEIIVHRLYRQRVGHDMFYGSGCDDENYFDYGQYTKASRFAVDWLETLIKKG